MSSSRSRNSSALFLFWILCLTCDVIHLNDQLLGTSAYPRIFIHLQVTTKVVTTRRAQRTHGGWDLDDCRTTSLWGGKPCKWLTTRWLTNMADSSVGIHWFIDFGGWFLIHDSVRWFLGLICWESLLDWLWCVESLHDVAVLVFVGIHWILDWFVVARFLAYSPMLDAAFCVLHRTQESLDASSLPRNV